MSYTKKQFIEQAFTELAIGAYEFDIQSAEYQDALRKLDGMMGTWASKGINIGYPIPTSPENSDINQETNVDSLHNETIYLGLAMRIAPMFGKTVSRDTKTSFKQAYNEILRDTIDMTPKQLTTTPRGAGQKAWRYGNSYNRFINPNNEGLKTNPDGNLNLGN